MYKEKINFIGSSDSIIAITGQDNKNTVYEMTVYDDSVELESTDWVKMLRPVEGSSVGRLVNDIIADMDANGLTAVYGNKAA